MTVPKGMKYLESILKNMWRIGSVEFRNQIVTNDILPL